MDNVKSDKELIKEISTGNELAFQQLFDRHWKPLYAFVDRLIDDEDQTKDILQNSFMEIWKRKETLFVDDSLMPLLIKIAKNEVITLFRRNKVRLAGDQILISKLHRMEEADDRLIAAELKQEIDNELVKMPFNMRQCFRLSKFENKTVKEIALELRLSEQTVKNNISEALRRLRTALLNSDAGYLALFSLALLNLT